MPLFGQYCNYLLIFGVAVNFIIVVDFLHWPIFTLDFGFVLDSILFAFMGWILIATYFV